LFTVLLVLFAAVSEAEASSSPNDVSVKLKNYLGNQKDISLSFKGVYQLINEDKNELTEGQNYTIRLESGSLNLYRDGSKIVNSTSSFTIFPKEYGTSNYVTINGRAYLGNVKFTIENGYIRPINTLPLEDYLKGVVPNEMPAGWHVEALKAQAVAARTYALARISNVIDDTIAYQVYGGYIWNSSSYAKSNEAVDNTAGEVLRYGGNLISAVYSSSNGGHTESNSNYWGSTQVPYLVAKPDSYDPQIKWNFNIEKQLINTSGLDLTNPDKWWNAVSEQSSNPAIINNMKSYLTNKHHKDATIKIVGVPNLSVSNKNSSGKSTKGSIQLDYFVKNSNGTYSRDNADSLPKDYSKTLSGTTRYDTSVEIAKSGWNSSSSVVLGRGDLPVDALTGSVLADKVGAPLLLTQSNSLPQSVLSQIKALGATKVYLLGGTGAISNGVKDHLEKNGLSVTRVSGATRYATSVEIANELEGSSELIITSGDENSPDALSIASYAADKQIPILLTAKNKLSDEVKQFIKKRSSSTSKVYVIGGTGAVSDNVLSELKSLGISNVERVKGDNRYSTSIAIAKKFDFNFDNIFFARGDLFIDALPGAVLAAKKGAPVILTKNDAFPASSQKWLKELGVRPYVYYLGGEQAISSSAKEQIKQSLLGDIKKHTLKLDNENISELRGMVGGSIFKSFHIDSVSDQNGKITVNGKGYGHAVGMSQYGAKARADAGIKYVDILKFYYPNTVLSN
jgi:SpoIID/LytB domain protein